MNSLATDELTEIKLNLSIILKGVIIFLFIFDISLINLTNMLSTRKVILVLLLFYWILSIHKFSILNKTSTKMYFIFFINLMILLWLFILSLGWDFSSEAEYIHSRVIYFIIYSLVGSVLVAHFFKSMNEFIYAIILAMIFQSIIVFSQFSFESIRVFMESTFENSGNIAYTRTDRANGLGAEGAYLSLLLSTGLFFCSYFIIIRSKIELKYILPYLIILLATMLTGRTGLYIGLSISLGIGAYLLFKGFGRYLIKIVPIIILAFFTLSFFSERVGIDQERIDGISQWATNLFDEGLDERSVNHFMNMDIPSISNEMLLGTGVYRGITSNNTSIQHDSGYIQMYTGLGLIFSVIFYLSLFVFLLMLLKDVEGKKLKLFLGIYIILIFIVEVKEPFIFKYMPVSIIISSILLARSKQTTIKKIDIK